MPRRKQYSSDRVDIHVELNVTYECNLKCQYCNRLLDMTHIPQSHMTVKQAEAFIEGLRRSPYRAKRIKISGGEPRQNPQLREILEVLMRHHPELVGSVGICTNASRKDVMPIMPDGIGWRRSPPAKKLATGSMHIPVLVSPKDLLLQSRIDYARCSTIKHCGASCDAWGFTACSLMPILGRALGRNPYSAEMTRQPDLEICDHCMFAICWEVREGIRHCVEKGTIPHPTKSFADWEQNVKDAEGWERLV